MVSQARRVVKTQKDVTAPEKTPSSDIHIDTYGREYEIPTFSMKEVYDVIPKSCFERSYFRSYSYVVRDSVAVFALGYVAWNYIHLIDSKILRIAAWSTYGFLQGLFCTGLWVLAHECGHGAFSPSNRVNDITGFFLHLSLLVPYFSWKYTHGLHHKFNGNIDRDTVFLPLLESNAKKSLSLKMRAFLQGKTITENTKMSDIYPLLEDAPIVSLLLLLGQQLVGWILYLTLNVSGQSYKGFKTHQVNHFNPKAPMFQASQWWSIVYSDIGMIMAMSALYIAYQHIGFSNLALMYFVPYFWVNHWLVLITYLQHTDPAVPHYRKESWTFERGAVATMDRSFGFIGRNIFHRIMETHVLHHLISRIPHYNAEEATKAAKKVLGSSYMNDPTNVFISLWRSARMCQYVSDQKPIVFFRNSNRLGANHDGKFDRN